MNKSNYLYSLPRRRPALPPPPLLGRLLQFETLRNPQPPIFSACTRRPTQPAPRLRVGRCDKRRAVLLPSSSEDSDATLSAEGMHGP